MRRTAVKTLDSFKSYQRDKNKKVEREDGTRTRREASGIQQDVESRISHRNGDVAAVLRELIATGEANADAISICLEAAYQNAQKVEHHQDHVWDSSQSLAVPILEHVWSDPGRWMALVNQEVATVDHLCYFAVREGRQELIEQCLGIDVDTSLVPSDLLPDAPRRWRGILFRALLQAHLEHDSKGSADTALICYFDILRRKSRARAEADALGQRSDESSSNFGITTMSIRPASVLLQTQIWRYPNTSLSLYDRFTAFYASVKEWDFTPDPSNFRLAVLKINRPRQPDERLMMKSLRELFPDNEEADSVYRKLPKQQRPLVYRYLHRALEVVRLKSNRKDEIWLEEVLKTFPAWQPKHGPQRSPNRRHPT